MAYEKECEVALEAGRRAGEAILELYADFVPIPDAHQSISTEADRKSQEIIQAYLHEKFPSDAFSGEEQTPALASVARTGTRLWIVDPIDGTRGFAKKTGEFSVMIAFVHNDRVAVGLVLEPALERITWAVRGGGCWRRDRHGEDECCRVTTTQNLSEATLTQSHSKPEKPSPAVQRLQPRKVIETYSAGIKLAQVARGEADLYVNDYPNFYDWDIAAGDLLVTEAGGRVTGLGGQPLLYGLPGARQPFGLLGSNGLLHDPALELLRGVL